MSPSHASWIRVGGVPIRYLYESSEADLTVVLVHELGGMIESWAQVRSHISCPCSVLSYDFRGAGLSGKSAAEGLDELADELQALVASLGITKPLVVVGVAFGASIAIRFAARWPNQVAGLVACVPALGQAEEQFVAADRMADDIESQGMQVIGEFAKSYPANLRERAPDVFVQFSQRNASNDPKMYAQYFRLAARVRLDADFPRVKSRTYIVGGMHDLRPAAQFEAVAQRHENFDFFLVDGGHYMNAQAPAAVAQLIDRMVSSLTQQT